MKNDIPLLNQPSRVRMLGLEWLRFEAEQVLKNRIDWEARRRVYELRKSCGIESDKTSTVSVRLPPRYHSGAVNAQSDGDA